jgi:hypothetical protein
MSTRRAVKPLPTDAEELALLRLRLQIGVRRFLATNGGFRYLSQIYDNYAHIDKSLLDETLAKMRTERAIVYRHGMNNRKGQPITVVWLLTEGNPFTSMTIIQGEGIEPMPPDPVEAIDAEV